MIITNKDELSLSGPRRQALDIIEAGLKRVLPSTILVEALKFDSIERNLIIGSKTYNIAAGRIFVIGGGKASGLMAETLEKILGSQNIAAGVINCTSAHYPTRKIKIFEASHPTPDERGVRGVERMLALREQYEINKHDLVACLISGGGSALLPYPAAGINLEDKQHITKLLIKCGADIHEINAVRKHLSGIKGGRLALYFSPARVVSCILSDVTGNHPDVIASGPTVPDDSTFFDAYKVLETYDLVSAAPQRVLNIIKKGCKGEIPETPKTLDNCDNHIIGDNRLALEAMAAKARTFGFKPYIVTAEQTGDPGDKAKLRAMEIRQGKYKGYDVLLIGGETTPKLPKNPGTGGRNQHYAAVSLSELAGFPGRWLMASVATDGADYIKEAAGALVDPITAAAAKSKKIDIRSYINRFDSYNLLKKIGGSLIETGSTGTNVCDVIIYIFK